MKFGTEPTREGPQTYTVPARQVTSCDGCKHFVDRCVMHGMRRNEYVSECNHPEWEQERGRQIARHGGVGGSITPSWCPFIRKPASAEGSR